MKYFLDTEFIEGFHKPMFGKRRHFIDLISMGIVAEDGREYYAISNEFDEKKASDWVTENVLTPIMLAAANYPAGGAAYLSKYSKSNKQIAKEIVDFVRQSRTYDLSKNEEQDEKERLEWCRIHNIKELKDGIAYHHPEFYGYYADYDWVLFASLWGKMIYLPKGFPMYCRDLKQMFDDKVEYLRQKENYSFSFDEGMKGLRGHPDYPTQENKHNALDDAKWNKKLYDFLQRVK